MATLSEEDSRDLTASSDFFDDFGTPPTSRLDNANTEQLNRMLIDEVEQVPSTEIDLFETNVYKFFKARGFRNIVVSQVVNLLFVSFLSLFCIFLFSCVDIHGIMNIHDPSKFYQLSDYIKWSWLGSMRWYMIIATIVFSLFFAWRVVRIIFDIHKMWRMKTFYNQHLNISDFELSTIRWQSVVEGLGKYQNQTNFYTGKDELNAHNIANRILKKDNYMIAMINNQLFDFKIPFLKKWWDVSLFTTSMEWNLQYGIMNYFFDDRMKLKRSIINADLRENVIEDLRRRVRLISLINIVLLPFLAILYLLWALFEHGEQLYKTPARLLTRTWNPFARWKFRDFNELPHVLQERLRLSEKCANEYMKQFSSHWMSTLAKFVAFIMSTFLVMLFVMTLFNDVTLFNLEITKGHSTFWFIGIFSTVLLIARGLEVESSIFYPRKKMETLAKFIRDIPNEWIENATTMKVKSELSRFFEYRLVILGKELIGLLINPIIIWMNIDPNIPHIVDFMRDYTLKHEKLGYVCQFSVFNEFSDNSMMNSTRFLHDIEGGDRESLNNTKLQMSMQNFNERYSTGSSMLNESLFSDTMQVNDPKFPRGSTLIPRDVLASNRNNAMAKSMFSKPMTATRGGGGMTCSSSTRRTTWRPQVGGATPLIRCEPRPFARWRRISSTSSS